MTREQYSKANDIMVEIQHYQDIIDVLKNAKGNELCARKLIDMSIMNTVHIMDEPIRDKLIALVKGEIKLLEDKFSKL